MSELDDDGMEDKEDEEDEEDREDRDDETSTGDPYRGPETRRRTARMGRHLIPKGYATALQPQMMSTEITAQELDWWTR